MATVAFAVPEIVTPEAVKPITGSLKIAVKLMIVLALMCLTFYWLGTRRANNLFVSWADSDYQAKQYQAATRSYTWAVWADSRRTTSLTARA